MQTQHANSPKSKNNLKPPSPLQRSRSRRFDKKYVNTYAGRAEAAQAKENGTRCVGLVLSPSPVVVVVVSSLLREAREHSVCAQARSA